MSLEEGSQGMGEGSQFTVDTINDNTFVTERDSQKKLSICPMCKGKGYYEEIGQPEINTEANIKQKMNVLPSISHPGTKPYKLEQLFKVEDARTLGRLSDPSIPMTIFKPNTRFPSVHIPNTTRRTPYGSAGQVKSSPNNTRTANLVNLLPPPTKLEKHPEDVARLAAIKLNRSDWETKKSGLEDCLRLATYNPEELEPHMSLVYRAMSSLLNNFRPQVTLFTCQAAREFFIHMRSTCRPEYDELVYSLLNRTADTNRHIRLYANDALDKMVTYIPTVHAVRPLVEKGPGHNNPLVRTATARLLTCVVAFKTPSVILTHPSLRDICKRILETAALLLADSNLDTRAAAKKLFQRFMNEDEFEGIYYGEVDEKLRNRVNRTYVELKYKKHMQAQ